MQLTARDKRALILGAIAVVLLLAFLLWPRGGTDSAVELVPRDQRGAPAGPGPGANTAPPPAMPPQPAPPMPVQPPVAAAAATPVPEGLKLTGITATGAIFAFPDGSQRLVVRGREVAPGLTLQAVRLREVLLSTGSVNLRLGFSGTATPVGPPAGAIAVPAPAPATTPAPNAPSPPLDRNLFR